MPPSSKSASDLRRLVIVESPAKAKTIAGYLGPGYTVEASIGHIRDLPNKETRDKLTDEEKASPWANLGVDLDHDFRPFYVISENKDAHIAKLRKLVRESDELLLATDEDREGEAIAQHLLKALNPKIPYHRMVFHEITKDAIQGSLHQLRTINDQLVEAQEARRVLDRIYGFEISPVLWRKIASGTSAGRVQSVTTRLVVERERERMAFRSAEYWDLTALFDTDRAQDDPRTMGARLVAVDGKRVAQGRDFGADGQLGRADALHLDQAGAAALAAGLTGAAFTVNAIDRKPYRRSPSAPFRTTTLQQEASRKLGFGAQRTMSVAQKLYENGFITYMRTDSVTLSETAVTAARAQVTELYGADYLPDKARTYTSKVKNAQEAHEAIRPSGTTFRTPASTKLSGDEFRLYELIWKRTVASQMKDAIGNSVTIRVGGTASDGRVAEFTCSGKVITFHGFMKAYVEGSDDPDAQLDDQDRRLPDVSEGQALRAAELAAEDHSTKPPARYTEASLVEDLEKREIGRPSTYATFVDTIQQRGYVFKKGTALVPSFLAFSVVGLLEKHFSDLVDYEFTAHMEEDLDRIARGEAERVPWLKNFYFGEGGLKDLISDKLNEIDARETNTFPIAEGIALRVGKYGPYIERYDAEGNSLGRANVPDGTLPDELTPELAEELLARPSGDRDLGTDPATGYQIVAKDGRYGPYVAEVLPEDAPKTGKNAVKPRNASLFKSMDLEAIDLANALRLLALPRVVGVDPESGEEITAQNGRFGPYLRKGEDSRSLSGEEQIFDITLDEALAVYAQPKQFGRRGAAKPPLRAFGEDPETGKPVVAKDGRFGAYVTDGETNVTVPRGTTVEELTVEQAFGMLAEKRAKGPAKKTAKKTAAKKTAAKTTTAKKTAAKKTVAKKSTAAKKSSADKSE
ncbi:type I DNA topoisomerase [Actinospica durhamensis]|uniref:type I DNA topoisomerase n=1 Tax=Actinospica durhamensis TaxID=1508375 RepID=UPI0027DB5199|nr:type I DNA topoisomerase [Actinospica durhamensis]